MKYLFTLLVLFSSTTVFAYEEMYYCSHVDSGGFHNKGNGYELLLLSLKKFKIKIDFSNLTIDSKDLSMEKGKAGEAKCQTTYDAEFFSCNNALGRMFTINRNSLRYTFASTFGYVSGTDKDTIWVAYGTCEKF
mgnify:FL=1